MAPTSTFLQFLPLLADSISFGVYSGLFFQCLQILYKRRGRHRHGQIDTNFKLYLGVMCALYSLSTFQIVLAYTWAGITDVADSAIYEVFTLEQPAPVLFELGDPPVVRALATLIRIRWVLANAIADAVVIHRCYIIWGGNWKIVVVPLLAYACTLVGGLFEILPLSASGSRIALSVAYSGVVGTNVLASTLTAGRIWFLSRRLGRFLPEVDYQPYARLSAIVLESGLMYPLVLLVTLVIFLCAAPTTAVLVPMAIAYQLVGIAPTLMIVRVGLGVSIDEQRSNVLESSQSPRVQRSGLRFAVSSEASESSESRWIETKHESESVSV
ncbi:Rtt106 domain-containing protein [Mycena chlorophos]|uniref:Rtt106 domain-containing protein n=1 Tax=Mycena chlorophos TaxID=658473 RepID=A0A8H6TDP9_MYCCL|nr:Rtt106 domain-containing protein [Mycena chlorophos]